MTCKECAPHAQSRSMRWLAACLAVSAALLSGPGAFAQSGLAEKNYPARPVRIVPYGPGGSPIDLVARVYAEQLRRILGQAVVVDPKPGASGILAADTVARAPADGYTILITLPTTHINNAILHTKLPYDPVKDFAPLSQLASGSGPVLVTSASAPYSTIAELLAYAKKKPAMTYGTWGVGTTAHLFGELLKREAIPDLIHVPYKTESMAHQDMEGGRIDLAWANPGTARAQTKTGRMKILGSLGAHRTQILPDVPLFVELGFKGFELESWIGAYAPAGIPMVIRDKLVAALQEATQVPEVQARLNDAGFEPLGNTPQEFSANYRADYKRLEQLIEAAGIRASD